MNYCDKQSIELILKDVHQPDNISESLYVYVCPLLVVGCLISVFLNAALLIIGHFKIHQKSPVLLLSLNLATTDTLASLLVAIGFVLNSYLPKVYDIQFSACPMLAFEICRTSALLASVIHLFALAFVHYRGIVKPLHYRDFTLFCTNHLTYSINFITLIAWIVPLFILTLYFSTIPCQGFLSPTCDYLFLASKRYRFFLLGIFLTPLILMFLLYVRIFVIIAKNQKRRSQLTNHMCRQSNNRKAIFGQSNSRSSSFDIDRCKDSQIPKITLEQELNLKRPFYSKLAFLPRTLSSKSYAERQQQPQQKLNKNLDCRLNAFQKESETSRIENNIINKMETNCHSHFGNYPIICDQKKRYESDNNKVQLTNESSHGNSLTKKENRKLSENRLIQSYGIEERTTVQSNDGNPIYEAPCSHNTERENENSEGDFLNNNQQTFLFSSSGVDRNMTNNQASNNSYDNGTAYGNSYRLKNWSKSLGKANDKQTEQTSTIKEGRQTLVQETNESHEPNNQFPDQKVTSDDWKQQRIDHLVTPCIRQPNAQTSLQSNTQPDKQNGAKLALISRQLLLNKFKCDCCFGLGRCSRIARAGSCRLENRRASHSSLESSDWESHLSYNHLACSQHFRPHSVLDEKNDCRLIKLIDNCIDSGTNGDATETLLSKSQPSNEINLSSACYLSNALCAEQETGKTNLAKLNDLVSSLHHPKLTEQHTSSGPALIKPTTCSNPQLDKVNQSNLSPNSLILFSNKSTCFNSAGQTLNSRDSLQSQLNSPEKLILRLVKKNSTYSSKSFQLIQTVEIQDDLPVSGDAKDEKAVKSSLVPNQSPNKLNVARSHLNYPRKLRNKLNANIHGSRSVRFHTKALFTTLIIHGTYLVCIMPALIFLVLTCVDGCIYPLFSISITKRVVISMITNSLVIIKSITDAFIYIYRIQEVKLAVRQFILFGPNTDEKTDYRPQQHGKPTLPGRSTISYHSGSIKAKSSINRHLSDKDLESAITAENLETIKQHNQQASLVRPEIQRV